MNPYAPPHAALRIPRRAAFSRFTSLGHASTLSGAAAALCILAHTRSAWLFAAVLFITLMLRLLHGSLISWISDTLTWHRDAEGHHGVTVTYPTSPPPPQPRAPARDSRITLKHRPGLGHAYSGESGSVVLPTIAAVSIIHIAVWLIFTLTAR